MSQAERGNAGRPDQVCSSTLFLSIVEASRRNCRAFRHAGCRCHRVVYADIFYSLIVWGGLRITTRPADEEYPYGYGKAEALAAAIVSLMLLGAALGVAVAAIGEILTPHRLPAPFTLAVLAAVIPVKEVLFRRVVRVGSETGSTAVKADAWHHRSDALTSAAALIGIGVALWGGPGWEAADDWAALVAAVVIALNGILLLRPAIHDLMDRMPDRPIIKQIAATALEVEGVRAIEKLRVRKVGADYFVDVHVQADETLPLLEGAHPQRQGQRGHSLGSTRGRWSLDSHGTL